MNPGCAPACAERRPRGEPGQWALERVLFAMAGTVTLVSAALAALVSPWFLLLTAFVGINQWLYVAAGACPASLVISRAFGLRSVVYPQKEVEAR
jgi:hypothetical protein